MSETTTSKRLGGRRVAAAKAPGNTKPAKSKPKAKRPPKPRSKRRNSPVNGKPLYPSSEDLGCQTLTSPVLHTAVGNYPLAIEPLPGADLAIGNAHNKDRLLLGLSQQAKLLRFLLTRQDLFSTPLDPPFVVRVQLPYETDKEQTTPYKTYLYSFGTIEDAESVCRQIEHLLKDYPDPDASCDVLGLPEKDLYVDDLKLFPHPAEQAPYAFLNEVLEESEHREQASPIFKAMNTNQWREMALTSMNLETLEEAIGHFTTIEPTTVFKDAVIASRSK